MAEVAEKIPGIGIILIVIFVVAIIFLTFFTDTGGEIIDIFDQTLFPQTQAQAKLATQESFAEFIQELNDCNSGKRNPSDRDQCFCNVGSFGVISDKSYFSIRNTKEASKITALDENSAPLKGTEQNYNLGLFVTEISSEEEKLACIFPQEFFIQGREEKSEVGLNEYNPVGYEVNNWYVIWQDERANRALSEQGEDQVFGFYRDKEIASGYQYGYYLRSTPILYKVSDSQYCLLTDLVEHRLTSLEGLNPVYLPIEQGKHTIIDFFTDTSKYCTQTVKKDILPGTFYWYAEDGTSGKSETLFGTKWLGGYICGVDAYSLKIHLRDYKEKEEIIEIYNENTKREIIPARNNNGTRETNRCTLSNIFF